jgi:hypothetical protein
MGYPPPSPAPSVALPRTAHYAALALISGPLFKFLEPWFTLQYQAFIDGNRHLYGGNDGMPILIVCLALPAIALLGDVVGHAFLFFSGRGTPAPRAVLGTETLLFMQSLLYVIGGASLTATFGGYPRELVLATLVPYYAAYFLVARALGWLGLFFAVTPLLALGIAWPVVLPLPAALAAAAAVLAIAGTFVRSRPADYRAGYAPAAAFLIGAAMVTGSCFLLMDYGLTLGLNVVPEIQHWNVGRFARMERACLATLARYPTDPVSRMFLCDVRSQQNRGAEARELAQRILDSGAGFSCGGYASKVLMRLDAMDRVRAGVNVTSPPPAAACAGVAREVREAAAILATAAKDQKQLWVDAEMAATQLLPGAREAVRKAPECAEARALLVECARLYAKRLRKFAQPKPDPADPRAEDLEAEAAKIEASR